MLWRQQIPYKSRLSTDLPNPASIGSGQHCFQGDQGPLLLSEQIYYFSLQTRLVEILAFTLF